MVSFSRHNRMKPARLKHSDASSHPKHGLLQGGFDRHYHSAGRDVLVRTQAGLKYRHGIDVGNGKGVHFMDTSHSKEGLWVHKAKVMLEEWRRKGEKTKRASSGGVPIADSVIDPKYLITPRHIFHISGSVPASKVGIPGAKGSAERSKGL